MASNTDLKKLVGQLFIAGFEGTSISDTFRSAIREYHFGGMLLLKGNVESPYATCRAHQYLTI